MLPEANPRSIAHSTSRTDSAMSDEPHPAGRHEVGDEKNAEVDQRSDERILQPVERVVDCREQRQRGHPYRCRRQHDPIGKSVFPQVDDAQGQQDQEQGHVEDGLGRTRVAEPPQAENGEHETHPEDQGSSSAGSRHRQASLSATTAVIAAIGAALPVQSSNWIAA
jgi:hypothetical protein